MSTATPTTAIHCTDWYGRYGGSLCHDRHGTGAPADGSSYAPPTTDEPWSADTSGESDDHAGDSWS